MINILFSPLEQFQIVPFFSIYYENFDISITNETIILFVILFIVIYCKVGLTDKNSSFFIIPDNWQLILENLHKIILSTLTRNVLSSKNQSFFPVVFSVFLYVLLFNLIGLIPFSFSVTSHLVVTFSLSSSIFIGINIICIRLQGLKFFSLFLPGGIKVKLGFVLVPIEIISYTFKPVSLAVRLFVNTMSGHALIHIIGFFSYRIFKATNIIFIFYLFPILLLTVLFYLEFVVAVIQAFVFTILICFYINDVINIH